MELMEVLGEDAVPLAVTMERTLSVMMEQLSPFVMEEMEVASVVEDAGFVEVRIAPIAIHGGWNLQLTIFLRETHLTTLSSTPSKKKYLAGLDLQVSPGMAVGGKGK